MELIDNYSKDIILTKKQYDKIIQIIIKSNDIIRLHEINLKEKQLKELQLKCNHEYMTNDEFDFDVRWSKPYIDLHLKCKKCKLLKYTIEQIIEKQMFCNHDFKDIYNYERYY